MNPERHDQQIVDSQRRTADMRGLQPTGPAGGAVKDCLGPAGRRSLHGDQSVRSQQWAALVMIPAPIHRQAARQTGRQPGKAGRQAGMGRCR